MEKSSAISENLFFFFDENLWVTAWIVNEVKRISSLDVNIGQRKPSCSSQIFKDDFDFLNKRIYSKQKYKGYLSIFHHKIACVRKLVESQLL